MCWQSRIDLVGKPNPPINFSFTDIFLADDHNQAIDLAVKFALKKFNSKHFRFISEVVVSKYFVNYPSEVEFTSGQGCSVFTWRHDSSMTLANAAKKAKFPLLLK